MYSRDQIDQVRSSVDLVETIREYVPSLKVSGRSVKGLCPFHNEKTPSFHVNAEKGLYKCFGCGEGGDVFAFLSKLENLTFAEAVDRMAAKAGITLRREKNVDNREPESVRQKLMRLLESAQAAYEDQLWNGRHGEMARKYLEERHVTDETAQEFHLGAAPLNTESIFEGLVKKGYSIELCQQAGLVTRSTAGRYYDPLYGRLIFPIFDPFGHVVGFGGRSLPKMSKGLMTFEDDDEKGEAPKYINSPETPVFSKGKLLYGLHQAKASISSTRRVMILEGYMDVIGVHQGGVKMGVATLGTALTRDHAKLIKRYADEATSFFDADEAGRRAAVKGLEPLLQENLFPRVVLTSEVGDPDEIIFEKGAAYFNELLNAAPDFVDYMLKTMLAQGDGSLQQKALIAKTILPLINVSANEILRSEWTKKVAVGLSLNLESLSRELGTRKPSPNESNVTPVATARKGGFIPSAEEEYLQLVVNVPDMWNTVLLSVDDFIEPRQKLVMGLIQKQVQETHKVLASALFTEIPETEKEWFMRLAMEEKVFDEPMDRREQLVRDIRLRSVKQRFSDLSGLIRMGTATTQEQDEYKDLLRKVKGSPMAAIASPPF